MVTKMPEGETEVKNIELIIILLVYVCSNIKK